MGGTLSGLASGASVVLQNNAASNLTLSANGSFSFPAQAGGSAYAVTVLTQPSSPAQTCTVTNGAGSVVSANVTNVQVTCSTSAYAVGGAVSGLSGGTVILQLNGANDLSRSANGAFAFSDVSLTSGEAYAVTVLTNPTAPGPGQTCTVVDGSGTIGTAPVADVVVDCSNDDQTVPTVLAHDPLPTAVGSKIQGGVVSVTFSEAIDTATFTGSSFRLEGPSGPVPGTISFAAGDTQAIFTPTTKLAFDETYTATLTTAVRDPSGNALAAAEWSFNTGKKLAFGFRHTCGRLDDGSVKCWGENQYGQLGYEDTDDRGDQPNEIAALVPVDLGPGRTAIAIAAGDHHSCAILDNGDSKCWGRNFVSDGGLNQGGTLGQGVTGAGSHRGDGPGEMGDNLLPINLGAGRRAVELVGGQNFACARLDDASIKCWGINPYGELGNGSTAQLGIVPGDIAAAQPVALGAGLTPLSLSLGHHNVCVIVADGGDTRRVKCWGRNNWGQLGLGNTTNRGGDPADMGDNLPFVDLGSNLTPETVLSNGGHNCALVTDSVGARKVKCWGLNTWGQLGLANGISAVPLADRLSCSAGPADCVGDAPDEMGDTLEFSAVSGDVARLTIGYRHSCVRSTGADELWCWGSNEEGQLGTGNNAGSNDIIGDQPGEVAALAPVSLVPGAVIEEATVGGFHSCVWNTDGTLNCWGDNVSGQLGHDTTLTWGDDPAEMGIGLPNTDLGN